MLSTSLFNQLHSLFTLLEEAYNSLDEILSEIADPESETEDLSEIEVCSSEEDLPAPLSRETKLPLLSKKTSHD